MQDPKFTNRSSDLHNTLRTYLSLLGVEEEPKSLKVGKTIRRLSISLENVKNVSRWGLEPSRPSP